MRFSQLVAGLQVTGLVAAGPLYGGLQARYYVNTTTAYNLSTSTTTTSSTVEITVTVMPQASTTATSSSSVMASTMASSNSSILTSTTATSNSSVTQSSTMSSNSTSLNTTSATSSMSVSAYNITTKVLGASASASTMNVTSSGSASNTSSSIVSTSLSASDTSSSIFSTSLAASSTGASVVSTSSAVQSTSSTYSTYLTTSSSSSVRYSSSTPKTNSYTNSSSSSSSSSSRSWHFSNPFTSSSSSVASVASSSSSSVPSSVFSSSSSTVLSPAYMVGISVISSPTPSRSGAQALALTTETITSVFTTTMYYTVGTGSTASTYASAQLTTRTEYSTFYNTVTISALQPLRTPAALATGSSCVVKTITVTLPASASPTSTASASNTSDGNGFVLPGQTQTEPLYGSGTVTGSSVASATNVQFCPNMDGSVWTDAQGDMHAIYCNTGFNGTQIYTNGSAASSNNDAPFANATASGRNMTTRALHVHKRRAVLTTSANTLAGCIAECDEISDCIGTAFDGSTCTYYSALANSYSAPGVQFAKVANMPNLKTASSTSSSSVSATAASLLKRCVTESHSSSASTSHSPSSVVDDAVGTSVKTASSSKKTSSTTRKTSSSTTKKTTTSSTARKTTTISSVKHTSSTKKSSSSTKTSTSTRTTSKSTSSLKTTTSSKTSTTSHKSSTTTSKRISTTKSTSSSSKCSTATPPAATQTGIVSGCTEYYVAVSGDYCYTVAEKYGISTDTFMEWNPAVDAPSCNNMLAGDAYCVAVGCPSASSTSTTLTSTGTTTTSMATKTTATSTTSTSASTSSAVAYKQYTGNGTVAAGWPALSDWLDFDTLFSLNEHIMEESCENNWAVPNDSASEIANVKSAILSVANSTGVDPRFILAIVMQESNGCVRVITTSYSVSNPGLMQSHDGAGSCNNGTVVQDPCPDSEIVQMIEDGTAGTSTGDGLLQCLAETDVTDVSMYYRAARIYNGGVGGYDADNLGAGCCTLCYSSDVANRLVGWSTGSSECTL